MVSSRFAQIRWSPVATTKATSGSAGRVVEGEALHHGEVDLRRLATCLYSSWAGTAPPSGSAITRAASMFTASRKRAEHLGDGQQAGPQVEVDDRGLGGRGRVVPVGQQHLSRGRRRPAPGAAEGG